MFFSDVLCVLISVLIDSTLVRSWQENIQNQQCYFIFVNNAGLAHIDRNFKKPRTYDGCDRNLINIELKIFLAILKSSFYARDAEKQRHIFVGRI